MTLAPESQSPGNPLDSVNRGGSSSNTAVLKMRYEGYCQHQVSRLLELIPKEAVRSLYRRARTWAMERGVHESKDPMSTLRAFCRELLPLPPFEAWQADYENNRVAHGSAGVERSPLAEPKEPVAVDVRRIEYEAEPWQGTLEVYRGDDRWRGVIRFQRDGEEGHFRTGEIFCEDDLQDLRDRFTSFTAPTMSAFLRSTLP